jgi:hypothetical protein
LCESTARDSPSWNALYGFIGQTTAHAPQKLPFSFTLVSATTTSNLPASPETSSTDAFVMRWMLGLFQLEPGRELAGTVPSARYVVSSCAISRPRSGTARREDLTTPAAGSSAASSAAARHYQVDDLPFTCVTWFVVSRQWPDRGWESRPSAVTLLVPRLPRKAWLPRPVAFSRHPPGGVTFDFLNFSHAHPVHVRKLPHDSVVKS